jgi:hypothetical protein
VNTEEGQPSPAREPVQLAAGESDAVYFVKAVSEKRNARMRLVHIAGSSSTRLSCHHRAFKAFSGDRFNTMKKTFPDGFVTDRLRLFRRNRSLC